MKLPAAIKTATPLLLLVLALAPFSLEAHAAIDNAGLLDSVLARYSAAAAGWAGAITSAATWLFWTLTVISMVWTFGFMAMRKADIGDFFAEFVRFTIFTGFFWWLLTNGPNFARSIMDGLRQVGSNATGLTSALSPSGIVDIGFAIFNKVLENSSMWSPVDSAVGIILAASVLVILALVGVNMLLLLVSGWILAYAGIFFLGFGGSRWTSDIAINYYKTVLGVAAQLFTMVLLVGIGKTFLDDYYTRMSAGVEFSEMGVMLIVSVVLLMLVNKVPSLISGIISGGSIGHSGIGNFGAGAAVGAAGMAAAAAATGGAMLAAGAANASGGAQAVMTAFSNASDNVQSGSDVLTSMWGGGSGGGGGGRSEKSTDSTPFAQAAGFASSGGGQASGGSSGAKAEGPGRDAKGKDKAKTDQGKGGESTGNTGASTARKADGVQPQGSGGGLMASAGKAGLIAADAAANLAKGTAQVAKEKFADLKDAAMDRIAETTGGKIAAAIKTGNAKDEAARTIESMPTFGGDSLAGAGTSDADAAAEVAAFANRDTKSA